MAGRNPFKPQSPDVPGAVVCLELSGKEKREYEAAESNGGKARVWAVLRFGGKGRIQTVFSLITNDESHAPGKVNTFVDWTCLIWCKKLEPR